MSVSVGPVGSPAVQSFDGGSSSSTYTVQRGDTLASIAADHGVSVHALEQANPQIQNPEAIHPGEEITIPTPDASGSGHMGPSGTEQMHQLGTGQLHSSGSGQMGPSGSESCPAPGQQQSDYDDALRALAAHRQQKTPAGEASNAKSGEAQKADAARAAAEHLKLQNAPSAE